MKALVYTGTQELVYRDEPNPIEVSGESILKIHASGICGSDMHAYHGHDDRSCLLYTSPSPRDRQKSRMPSSA